MQTNGKAGEPSMDEILASIRKIIAEEPGATPSLPQTAPPVPSAKSVQAPAGKPTSERRGPADLERELAELLREPIEPVAAPSAPARVSSPVSTLAQGHSTDQPVVAPAERAVNAGGLGSWLRNRAGTAAASPPIVEPRLEVPASQSGSVPGSAPAPSSAASSVVSGPEAAPVVNGNAVGSNPSTTLQGVLARLGSASSAGGKPSAAPIPGPVLSRPFTPDRSALQSASEAILDAPANRVQEPARPVAVAPLAEPLAVPAAVAEPMAEPNGAPVTASAATSAPVEPAASPAAPVTAGAVPPTAAPSPIMPAPASASAVQAAAPLPAPEATVLPVAIPAGTELEPTVVGTAGPAVGDAPATSPSERAAPPNVALDDALTGLLRPVVRQWLDENMTRALEKAVRLEMTDIVKSAMTKLGDPGKS